MYPTNGLSAPCERERRLDPRQELRREMFQHLLNSTNTRSTEEYTMKSMAKAAVEIADIILDTEPALSAKKEG